MSLKLGDLIVLVRGAGEMASGIAHRLHRCHMKVLVTEVAAPTAVRRMVAFAEAAYLGSHSVEGVTAVRTETADGALEAWERGEIPLYIDPEARIRNFINPAVIVDAIMAKKNSPTRITDAPLVIGVGPGFTAGTNVHAVVESNRGYNLGRVLWTGQAERDTGVPAPVAGHAEARVLRVSQNGVFKALRKIGDFVDPGEAVAEVDGQLITARIHGVVRGLLQNGIQVQQGIKAGDIDPRGEREYCYLISDKARAIGGGVLEAILHSLKHPGPPAT